MQTDKNNLKALGAAKVDYKDQYDPSQLERIERDPRRENYTAPMNGADIWTAFEVSYLTPSGLPYFLVLRIMTDAKSPFIFESKSLKLYLNSFNNTVVENTKELIKTIEKDLTEVAGAKVFAKEITQFKRGKDLYTQSSSRLENICRFTETKNYQYDPALLKTVDSRFPNVESTFYTDLLRSNCEITNQPDWGRVFVSYTTNKLELIPESFLKYIVSFRNHQEFHEPTCERIYNDLFELLQPKKLLVLCQYTRRGGIDINPVRYTHEGMLNINLIDLPKILQQ